MSNLIETSEFTEGIIQIETGDDILGGADGIANAQAKVLGNRTKWLKEELEASTFAGMIIASPVNSVPNGFLECNGAEISRNAYPELFAKIGTLYGAGDGATTFKIPDLRGEFIRGFDNGRGIDIGRDIGSLQLDGIKEHYHDLRFNTRASAAATDGAGAFASSSVALGRNTVDAATYHKTLYGTSSYQNLSGAAADTRPRNIAMMYCIKY